MITQNINRALPQAQTNKIRAAIRRKEAGKAI